MFFQRSLFALNWVMVTSASLASLLAPSRVLLMFLCLWTWSSMVLSISSSFFASSSLRVSSCPILSLRDSMALEDSFLFSSRSSIFSSCEFVLTRCLLISISSPLRLSCMGTRDSVSSSTLF